MFVLVHCHVVDGAVVGAQTTTDATVGVYAERGVFDNPTDEHVTDESAVDAWPVADKDVAYAVASLAYVVDELREFLVGFALLFGFFFGFIHVHEWQSDIRLGHDERYCTVHLDAHFRQVFFQNVDCFAHVVASRAYDVAVATGLIDA